MVTQSTVGKPTVPPARGRGHGIFVIVVGFILVFDFVFDLWFCGSMHRCMLDYFVERQRGVKGDEQYHVAIRVDREPTCCDVGAVSRRSFAMCGDPQGDITNGC